MKKLFLLLLFLGNSFCSTAQEFDRVKVVNRLADLMDQNYVYPDKGKAMHDLLILKLQKGEYDQYSTQSELAEALDADLKSIINDKHIRVRFTPEREEELVGREQVTGPELSPDYGFYTVKVLENNIGYLDLRGFYDIRFAEEVARRAMDTLIQSDAIIFDLRRNGGGSPSMIRFISSYIFGDDPVHLNTFYWRPGDNYSETWTDPTLASQTKPDIPIYVLTSDYTFSAAEEFTYNLKHLKRATIIGETTGGGAHPGGPMVINNGFFVNVPQGRAINPITETNWEGIGVIPHIQIPDEEALQKAIDLATIALENN